MNFQVCTPIKEIRSSDELIFWEQFLNRRRPVTDQENQIPFNIRVRVGIDNYDSLWLQEVWPMGDIHTLWGKDMVFGHTWLLAIWTTGSESLLSEVSLMATYRAWVKEQLLAARRLGQLCFFLLNLITVVTGLIFFSEVNLTPLGFSLALVMFLGAVVAVEFLRQWRRKMPLIPWNTLAKTALDFVESKLAPSV